MLDCGMEVVRSNFHSLLDTIIEDIRACDFIGCDGEFTGISKTEFKVMPFDTVSERYDKLRQGNMSYLMCQIGVCMFSQRDDGGYSVKPYNFYVMPQQFGHTEVGRATEFTCQASSINFLASHNFDFNKVFHEGISYLRPIDESRLRDILVEKQEVRQSSGGGSTPIVAKGPDKKYIDSIMEKIESYAASTGDAHAEPLELEPGSAFRRKLIYQHVEAKYADQLYLQSVGQGRQKHISVSRVSMEERKAKEKTAFDKKMAELDEAVGFSKVVREISNSKKLLVGHNMLLDLMYIISQFMSELPESYDEFKVMASELFPRLLDTKVMSSTYLFKEEIPFNSLDELVKNLSSSAFEQINFEIDEGFPDYEASDSDTKFHDAAYDAYVTGKSFAVMAQHVGSKASPPVHNLASNSKLLTPFINKLNLNRIQDIPYMNIGGPEAIPDREHVYHLTFPPTFNKDDINQVFFPSMVYVSWIDKTSAMVSLQDRSENAQVKSMLQSRTHACVIMPYAEWHRRKCQPAVTTAPSSDNSKKLEKRKLNIESSESSTKYVKLSPSEPADSLTSTAAAKEPAKLFEEGSW